MQAKDVLLAVAVYKLEAVLNSPQALKGMRAVTDSKLQAEDVQYLKVETFN